jgi:ABC-type glycerol-3-phosphate transport system substrate-binding protein
MKQRKHAPKRTALALWLAAALTLAGALAGCGGGAGTTAATTAAQGGAAGATTEAQGGAAEATTEAAAAAKAPVTITVFGGETEKTFLSGVQTDPVAKQIEKELGIVLNVVDQSTAVEKLQVLVASNDLPDLVECGANAPLQDMVDNGQVMALDGLIASLGPDITENAADALGYSQKNYTDDSGATFFVPGQVDPDGSIHFLIAPYVRWDYYAELGYPEVNGYDDVLDVVERMLAAHPTNENGQTNFGFSPWFDWDFFAFKQFTGYMEGYEVMGTLTQNAFTGELKDWVNDDGSIVWEGVRFWYKANQRGLLDPDALTQNYDQALEKGAANRLICSWTQWQQGNTNNDLESAGYAGRGIEPLPPFKGTPRYVGGSATRYGNMGRAWAISSKAKNPEDCMRLINWLFSVDGAMTVYNGVKGDSWTDEGGTYKYTESFLDAMKNDPDYVLNTGANKYNTWPGLGARFIAPNGQPLNLLNDKSVEQETYLQVDKDYCEHYGVEVKGDVIAKYAAEYIAAPPPLAQPTPPDDIDAKRAQIEATYIRELPKLVLAASDEDLEAKIQALRDELNGMGLAEVQAWYIENIVPLV